MISIEVYQWTRLRRAMLDALADGEAFWLTLHDRLRFRGVHEVEIPRELRAHLDALLDEGLAASRLVADEPLPARDGLPSCTRLRRLFRLTDRGADERARLVIP